MSFEFKRLAKQKCPYCSGWGHSGNDCPTDAKLLVLRRGVKEQSKVIQEIRSIGRTKANMGGVTDYSRLTPIFTNAGKKRLYPEVLSL